jgi:hypothetical protein
LRCASGSVVRLVSQSNVGGTSPYPEPGEASISVRGQVFAPGTRYYPCWYRNAAAVCSPSTFDLTNTWRIDWNA